MKLFELFVTFVKIGALSFGGGYAMIPFFEKEIAIHNWASAGDYKKVIALAQMVPGPFAIDSSAYIGYRVGGLSGALLASIALSLPSFLSLVFVSRYYPAFKSNQYIQLALKSVRPAIIGLLISAVHIIGIAPVLNNLKMVDVLSVIKPLLLISVGVLVLKYIKIKPVLFIFAFAIIGLML